MAEILRWLVCAAALLMAHKSCSSCDDDPSRYFLPVCHGGRGRGYSVMGTARRRLLCDGSALTSATWGHPFPYLSRGPCATRYWSAAPPGLFLWPRGDARRRVVRALEQVIVISPSCPGRCSDNVAGHPQRRHHVDRAHDLLRPSSWSCAAGVGKAVRLRRMHISSELTRAHPQLQLEDDDSAAHAGAGQPGGLPRTRWTVTD